LAAKSKLVPAAPTGPDELKLFHLTRLRCYVNHQITVGTGNIDAVMSTAKTITLKYGMPKDT
jgi:hypothetical protein